MTPSSYGYKIPDTGDLSKGVFGWFLDLIFNWNRINLHSHNGTDSAQLTLASMATPTVVAPSGSWVFASSEKAYFQSVTAPAGIGDINNYVLKFLIDTAGPTQYEQLQLQYVRLTGTTFSLYSNDNTIDVLCVFR